MKVVGLGSNLALRADALEVLRKSNVQLTQFKEESIKKAQAVVKELFPNSILNRLTMTEEEKEQHEIDIKVKQVIDRFNAEFPEVEPSIPDFLIRIQIERKQKGMRR